MVDWLRLLLVAVCVSGTWARATHTLSEESNLVHSSSLRSARSGSSRSRGSTLYIRKAPEAEYMVGLHDSVILECEAVGQPAPSIHWLKDNVRITQSVNELFETNAVSEEVDDVQTSQGRSVTRSRLYLDCTTPRDEGVYTCVAETPARRVTASAFVLTSGAILPLLNPTCTSTKKSFAHSQQAARIYMWSEDVIELMGSDVLLYCRTSGKPRPHITWVHNEEHVIENDDRHFIQDNGDLQIKNIEWADMGEYRCEAENKLSKEFETTFLYPARRN